MPETSSGCLSNLEMTHDSKVLRKICRDVLFGNKHPQPFPFLLSSDEPEGPWRQREGHRTRWREGTSGEVVTCHHSI